MDNMTIYANLSKTPKNATKTIGAGRLKGFTDINPMWRIKALTEQFGPCGIGWTVTPTIREIVEGANGEMKAFMQVELRVKVDGEWSMPIIGEGGSSFVSAERNGLYTDDECYKKAYTDAIGSACKLLGMSADIYWSEDRTKYVATMPEKAKEEPAKKEQAQPTAKDKLKEMCQQVAVANGVKVKQVCETLEAEAGKKMDDSNIDEFIKMIEVKMGKVA